MTTVTKMLPSGSTDGKPIKIAATATAGTLFHTAHASALDLLEMWLTNTGSLDVLITIELGGATAPDWNAKITVPANDTVLALAGIPLTNSLTCKAFAATANVVNMFGSVNRVS